MAIVSDLLLPDPGLLPEPGNAEAARLARGRWRESAARSGDRALIAFAEEALRDPAAGALLDAVFGNSPFLTHCLLDDFAFTRLLVTRGPRAAFTETMKLLRGDAMPAAETAALMRRLRIGKRRCALTAGMADITGAWPVEEVTAALSTFADAALQMATAGLLRKLVAAGELTVVDADDPERDSGVIILGMGKLGANELNYSSDIDLIILYDIQRVRYAGKDGPERCLVRFARNLVRVMDERTSDGYVFRTDLRLRPDPGSTPLAISVMAAEIYYEGTGQNWERAAMIKARPVAGDIEAGENFLRTLRPFVWRKNLDFAAIQDIHSIKRQINAHRGGAEIAAAGHNIKVGRGGIREIEFFVQTQQLIWGGRDPSLRGRGTLTALDALAAAGRVERDVARRLGRAYTFLRRVEHRLQMVDDRQTHTVPESEAGMAAMAVFLGYADSDAFSAALLAELRAVEANYADLFEESPDLSGPGNLVFTGSEDDPDTLNSLKQMGFRDPSVVSAAIRGWHHGRYRATRSTRARELLTELVPAILNALSNTVNPDAALLKFNDFLAALPAGVQLFSLFHANPGLLDLVAEIMGSAPRLADLLSRHPILLDGVLTEGFFDQPPTAAALAAELDAALGQAADYQDVLDVIRRWTNDRIFQLGVHMLRGRTDPEAAAAPLSDIADTGLGALLPAVAAEFTARHGVVPGGAMAVVGFGKLGGREMTVGSDLDLLFIYDAPPDAAASDGDRKLSPTQYFARLSQRFINGITAPTGEGRLYEVDMRLRPSGNAGPIAISLPAFTQYHRDAAWTWEHMALTRARIIAAPADLADRIRAAVHGILTRPRDADALLRDVADMRERMARERGTDNPWHIKDYRGGMFDVEFIAQYLQLRHAADHPDILSANTTDALRRIGEAGLIDGAIIDDLVAAMHLWRNVQGILRLSFGAGFDETRAPEGLRAALARAAGAADFDALRGTVVDTARRAHGHFVALIEAPAAALAGAANSAEP